MKKKKKTPLEILQEWQKLKDAKNVREWKGAVQLYLLSNEAKT